MSLHQYSPPGFRRFAVMIPLLAAVLWLVTAGTGLAAPRLAITQQTDNPPTRRSIQVTGSFDSGVASFWRLERWTELSGPGFFCAEGQGAVVAPWAGTQVIPGSGSMSAEVMVMPLAKPSVAAPAGSGPRPSWTIVRAVLRRLADGRVAARWPSGGSTVPGAAEVTTVFTAAEMPLADPWPGLGRQAFGVGTVTGQASDPLPIFLSFCSFPDPSAPAPAASTLSGTDVTIRAFLTARREEIRSEIFYSPNMEPPAPPLPVTSERRSFFRLFTNSAAALNGYGVPLGIAAVFDKANAADDRLMISEMCILNVAENEGDLVGGEAADWVEILNPCNQTLSTAGYSLSDNGTAWHTLPVMTLAPGQSLVMNCTEEGRARLAADDPVKPFTVPFSLKDDATETVRLGKAGTGGTVSVVHSLKAPEGKFPTLQPARISYGIRSNAAGTGIEYGFFSRPTRGTDLTTGARNEGWLSGGAATEPSVEDAGSPAGAPVAAYGRQFSSGTVNVRLTHPAADAVITYTLNGSEPNGFSTVYTAGSPIQIAGTTILRARAFRTGYVSSGVVTRTFIHTPSVFAQKRPEANGGELGSALNNPQIFNTYATSAPARAGLAAPGGILTQLAALPSVFLTWHAETPVAYAGAKAELPVHVEYSDPANPAATYAYEAGVLQDAGNHSNGGLPPGAFPGGKYSWHLIFKKAWNLRGGSTFNGPVIPAGQPNAGTSAIFPGCKIKNFHRLLLRNPSSDSWTGLLNGDKVTDTYCHDAYLKETQRDLSGPGAMVPRRRWTHVFVNAYYWGVYDLEEHIDEDMISSHLLAETPGVNPAAVEPEDITYMHYVSEEETENTPEFLVWKNVIIKTTTATGDKANLVKWNAVVAVLDIPAYIDYVLTLAASGKGDIKDADYRIWKNPLTGTCRVIAWDGDAMLNPGDAYIISEGIPTGKTYDLQPHEFLKTHPKYREAFDQRLRVHLAAGGALDQTKITARYLGTAAEFRRGLECEGMRWGTMERINAWEAAVRYFDQTSIGALLPNTRRNIMKNARELRMLTDISPPTFTIGVQNAQGTPVTISRVGPNGVLYYSYDASSFDPGGRGYNPLTPVYTNPSPASVTFTNVHNNQYIMYARSWALDLDGQPAWSPLTTYPEQS
ncbi:MAG: CotH kinase family protein [Verrucomicrobiota bacterium]